MEQSPIESSNPEHLMLWTRIGRSEETPERLPRLNVTSPLKEKCNVNVNVNGLYPHRHVGVLTNLIGGRDVVHLLSAFDPYTDPSHAKS